MLVGFHLMWKYTFANISAWALTTVSGVMIRRNLIGLPLLRIVNNSDMNEESMGMA